MGLFKLREFVESHELELRGLIAVFIPRSFQIPEGQRGPARKRPRLGGFTPLGIGGHQPLLGPIHQGTGQGQVGVGTPKQKRGVPRLVDVLKRGHQ